MTLIQIAKRPKAERKAYLQGYIAALRSLNDWNGGADKVLNEYLYGQMALLEDTLTLLQGAEKQ